MLVEWMFADFLEFIKLKIQQKLWDSVRKTKLAKFPEFYTWRRQELIPDAVRSDMQKSLC